MSTSLRRCSPKQRLNDSTTHNKCSIWRQPLRFLHRFGVEHYLSIL